MKKLRLRVRIILIVLMAGQLGACGTMVRVLPGVPDAEPQDRGPAPGSVDVSSIPDAVPRVEPRSRYGNPASYVVNGRTYHTLDSSAEFVERGIASWYGEKFHGRRTSSGEPYDMYAMTAAHKSLPLPTYVEVVNLKNGRKVIVKVNDRGPFHENRVIDLSYTAAAKLDILRQGTGLVEVRSIDPVTGRVAGRGAVVEAPVLARSTSNIEDGFYIQVGAFGDLVNANRLRERLGALAANLLTISEARVNGNTIYRVRFGPLTDVDIADRIVRDLAAYGVREHYISVD